MQPTQESVGAITFSLNAHCGDGLRLSQRSGSKAASISLGAPAAGAGSCKFGAHRSTAACKTILLRRRAGVRGAAAAAPFASLSLASVTLAPSKGAAAAPAKKKKSLGEVVEDARKKALRGGLPGMAAMGIQVLSLMWLRTTINYQYRHGGTMVGALKVLYAEGGIPRFYKGLLPALIQGPLSRFGDTAANTGVLALLEDVDIPVGVKTFAASAAAALFRIVLMPVDAAKTIMQVEGARGLPSLIQKVRVGGPTVLYHGALAASAATFVGHYPWFATYNSLDAYLPKYSADNEKAMRLLRSAFIGFCASFVSDCCSNSIRVIKTAKQTVTVPMTYGEVVKMIIEKDGVTGLFGRGLRTKIITNGLQGIMFSVLWRMGQDFLAKQDAQKQKEEDDKAAAEAAASKKKK